ncbi:hypothetical protein F5B22DRAFT_27092 [Xylaria bambusicola]|uniref:uncharacterized protein n=1 Tax=Xylaria bambusicola TaxID=326684 RepID=UPI0020082EBF|nr:uncharacterized protein F5B22DRAFT_27092 [Xylaria bambusicola]KAI0528221.1 hypothetical protein F5B22DRAFT_27092 [Xylaria bambusicola]
MAGIEVCGLALASFPLAISALELYREAAQGKLRLEWRKGMNELKYHQLLFSKNMELLLAPVVNDDEMHQLMASPGGDIWSDPHLAGALEERLKDSYSTYLKTISLLFSALDQLTKELEVAKRGISEPSNIKHQILRARFALRKRVRTNAFKDVEECNRILEKLIPKNDSVSISHPTAKLRVRSVEAALLDFWRHADTLYKALLTAWKCDCPDRHLAHLELRPRLSGSDQEVRLVLSTHTIRNAAPVWYTLPVITKIGQEPREPPSRVSSQWEGEAEPERAPGSKRKLTVRFAHTSLAKNQIDINSSMLFENRPIDNLCAALSNSPDISSIGYLRDPDGGQYSDEFDICRGGPPIAARKRLSELMGEGVTRLTRRQRYYLAVTISSSFIQLGDTPWFPETLESLWSTDSIFIPADAKHPDIFLLNRPFITRRFVEVPASETSSRRQLILDMNRLGIMLLELCFNMTIKSCPARSRFPSSDDPETDAAFDLIAALKWREDVNEEAGQEYSDAIEWCLVGCRMMSMTDNGTGVAGNWRRQMLEKVTLPLQRCFQYLVSDGAFDSSLNIRDPTEPRQALAPSSAEVLHDELESIRYIRTSTASSVVDSWDEDELVSRSDDFTQTSIDQPSETSGILGMNKVPRQDHEGPRTGAANAHIMSSSQDMVSEQWHRSPESQLLPAAAAIDEKFQTHSAGREISANATIEEIRRKAGLIECALLLLSYNDGEYEALSRTLATRFKLWLSVNGIFEESLVDRFSTTDDHSLLSLFINKMGRLERILPDPLGNDRPLSPGWDDLQKGRHLIDSLHRLGEAMRIEFPANSLVLRIRNMLSRQETSLMDIVNPSNVRQEISKSMSYLRPEQIESYISQICEDYSIVFATLVLLYKPGRILGFVEEKIRDDMLPINEEFLAKGQKRRGWRSDDAARFVHVQHLILDRLQELSSEETNQTPSKASISSIPIWNGSPSSSSRQDSNKST